jgi:hypothetical protein
MTTTSDTPVYTVRWTELAIYEQQLCVPLTAIALELGSPAGELSNNDIAEWLQSNESVVADQADYNHVTIAERSITDVDRADTPTHTYLVSYEIRSGITNSIAATGVVNISGPTPHLAREQAKAWVCDNDPRFDERIDPTVHINCITIKGEGDSQ